MTLWGLTHLQYLCWMRLFNETHLFASFFCCLLVCFSLLSLVQCVLLVQLQHKHLLLDGLHVGWGLWGFLQPSTRSKESKTSGCRGWRQMPEFGKLVETPNSDEDRGRPFIWRRRWHSHFWVLQLTPHDCTLLSSPQSPTGLRCFSQGCTTNQLTTEITIGTSEMSKSQELLLPWI